MSEPQGIRPKMGQAYDMWAPEGGKGKVLKWDWVRDRMYGARSYWVATTPKSGPPHTMPVWGVFLNDVFYFMTTGSSQKARNIARASEATVHLESADMVVIIEGSAREETGESLIKMLETAFLQKYAVEVVGKFPDQKAFSIQPKKVLAWQGFPESEFTKTTTRFDIA